MATWSSYQRHLVANGRPTEDYDAFLEQAATGKLRDGYGSWQQNVSSWLGRGAPSRLLVVDYDDLNAHTVEVLTKICDFMSLKTSPERIDLAIHANSRQAMRHREAESKGLRVRATPFVSLTNDQSGNRYLSRDATSVSVREATELWKEIRRSRLD